MSSLSKIEIEGELRQINVTITNNNKLFELS